MNPHDVLIADHKVLRSLLDELVHPRAHDVADRRRLLARFMKMLTVHAQIEDELYYPRVRDVTPLFAAAHAEHRQLDDQLAVLLRTSPASTDFAIEAQMLASILGQHADEEEQEMFPQVESLDHGELEKLGREVHERHQQLHGSKLMQTRIRIKREVLQRL
jgi:hemerythrin superfamily protein